MGDLIHVSGDLDAQPRKYLDEFNCSPQIEEPIAVSKHASVQNSEDELLDPEPFLCLPSFMRQALQLPDGAPKVMKPGRLPELKSASSPTSDTSTMSIPPPPGLDPPSPAKNSHDFKILFTGYDQEKHADFELVPRLIGKRGCNMMPIKKIGADVRVCGRGSGYLEVPGPGGKLVERDEAFQLAVSCGTQLSGKHSIRV